MRDACCYFRGMHGAAELQRVGRRLPLHVTAAAYRRPASPAAPKISDYAEDFLDY